MLALFAATAATFFGAGVEVGSVWARRSKTDQTDQTDRAR
jgi:hypothetical protein